MAKEPLEIKFGTDGWRAIIDREFNSENLQRCALGVANLLKADGISEKGVVVGYDTRLNSKESAQQVAEIISNNGIKVYLSESSVPTPVVSFNVVKHNAAAGIVITASHNSSIWNGFKFKTANGTSASVEVINKLESYINKSPGSLHTNDQAQVKNPAPIHTLNFSQGYIDNINESLNLNMIRQSGLKIAVDSMHGAGSGYISSLLSGNETRVLEIRKDPNPNFPDMQQPEPIAPNLKPLRDFIKSEKANVGLALDGDADRLGILDENGEFLSTLNTFSLLCLHMLDTKKLKGPIIRSITQSNMIDHLAKSYNIEIFQTPVGFKFIGPLLAKHNALAGGEESGGYAFRGNIPERDGIFSGLLFLEMMVMTGKSPSKLLKWLFSKVGEHHYDRIDIPLAGSQVPLLKEILVEKASGKIGDLKVTKIDHSLENGSFISFEKGYWALIRPSGTEPLVRIYCEADTKSSTTQILTNLKNILNVKD